MNSDIFISLFLALLQMQLRKCQNRYCQEAVDSVEIVESCPTSKTEWDNAAERKNCNIIALQQNCEDSKKFKYHCVINGLRDNLIEVCAPTRIIFGHCVEFNVHGGVIQDQKSAPCSNKTFPKCDDFYYSSDAYKYPDCYLLVRGAQSEAMSSTKNDITTLRATSNGSLPAEIINIAAALLILTLIPIIMIVYLLLKTRQQLARNKIDESEEAMLKGHYIEQGESKRVLKEELKTQFKSQSHHMNSILRRCFPWLYFQLAITQTKKKKDREVRRIQNINEVY